MPQTPIDTDIKDTGVTVDPEDVINEILPFCAQGQVGRDLLSQADYTEDMQRSIGHQPGIARAALANKQSRQAAHMAAGLAQFLARRYAPGVVDDGDLDKVEAALVAALDAIINSPAHLATLLRAGLVQPDGKTTTVDEDGLLSALGGNLLFNAETIITESGEWTAPVRGWYLAFLVAGGDGGMTLQSSSNNYNAYGGAGGRRVLKLMYLEAGDVLQAIIGAGGIGYNRVLETTGAEKGGATSFGDYSTDDDGAWGYPTIVSTNTLPSTRATGNGPGGGESWTAGKYYGAGGGAGWLTNASAYNGAQGAVFLYYHDPALAAGPVPVPALFAARRVAADAPATVRLYDPATGQGSVWREEDAEARQDEGLITEAAWLELCAQKAAEEYAEWLASPDTVEERLAMLRAEREVKLAVYDTAVAQLRREERAGEDVAGALAAWDAYANALCALPQQPGAPWDGGGEATPWPEAPAPAKAQEEA